MKQFIALCCLVAAVFPAFAQDPLSSTRALLQKTTRTPQETQQVLSLFRTAQDQNTIFAAGASLVKTPPAKTSEPVLLNQIVTASDPLKTIFSAVILTAMGSAYQELIPLLSDAMQTKDPILRAYVAGAYALLKPEDDTHATDIVRLYILDAAFAQRAMNFLTKTPAEQTALLKQLSSDKDPQIRAAAAAWLGSLHTPQALKQLLKRAKKEQDPSVQTQLALALAANAEDALPGVEKGLQTDYKKAPATTYALALGFMTGHAVSTLQTALKSAQLNQRINALRATAYMAGVLANPEGFAYSSDRAFDIRLLKSLIAPVKQLAANGSAEEQIYAQNALTQLEKLM